MHLPFHGKQHQEFGSKHFECLATSGSCHVSLLHTAISLLSSLNNIIWGAKKTSHGFDDAGKPPPIISLPESPSFSKKLPSSPWVFNSQLQPYRDHTPHGTTCFSILEGKDHLKAAKMGSKIFSQGGDPSMIQKYLRTWLASKQKVGEKQKKTTRDLGTWPSIKKPTYK